jgi:hypothetical protein
MTKAEMQQLAVTDQVRKGAVFGLVIGVTSDKVTIAWDGASRTPKAYLKAGSELNEVAVTRKAPQASFEGKVIPGYYR